MKATVAIVAGLLLVSPAAAQDAHKLGMLLHGLTSEDATTQMTAGFAACLKDFGTPEAITDSFTTGGWKAFGGVSDGVTRLEPPTTEKSFVLIAGDGSFCDVESLSLTTGQAGHVLALTLQMTGVMGAALGTDDRGCLTYALPNGLIARVDSGGAAPVCTSTETAAIHFARATETETGQ